MSKSTIRCFARHDGKTKEISRDDVSKHLRAGDKLWVDIEGPEEEDTAWLGETFGFHPLALSDVLNNRTRPKQESYDGGVLFIVFGALNFNKGYDKLDSINLNIFLTTNIIVTAHCLPLRSVREEFERFERVTDGLERGTGHLAYRIIDHIVDFYLEVLNVVDAKVSKLEAEMFAQSEKVITQVNKKEEIVRRVFSLKKRVTLLRRSVRPKRDLINELIHSDTPIFTDETRTHFRDVLDHLILIYNVLETTPDSLNMLLEVHLTQIGNVQNEVMKLLSIISTIMLPLSLIAGIYGMNFDLMPGTHGPHGFAIAIASMILIGWASLVFLRRKGFF